MIHATKQEQDGSALSPEIGTTRVEGFSDSVMAVIVTIMAFELRPPQGASLAGNRVQADVLTAKLTAILSNIGNYKRTSAGCSSVTSSGVDAEAGV